MKRLTLCAALITISLQGTLFAQENTIANLSKTERSFNMHPGAVHNRHWVTLPKDEKMIVELRHTDDYNLIRDLESLLAQFVTDIAFYKDSLITSGNVRIDYVVTSNPGIRKIRFKKYQPSGDAYINTGSDVSHLKIEQDTVRIVFERPITAKDDYSLHSERIQRLAIPLQVTFCLNNYSDMKLLLQEKGKMNGIISKLETTANPKHKKGFPLYNMSSVSYNTNDSGSKSSSIRKRNYLLEHERDVWKASGTLQITGSLGIGVIRNSIAPMAEMGIEINDRTNIFPDCFSYVRVSAMPYFFFDRDLNNNFKVYDNWFTTLEFGYQHKERRNSLGVGYLFAEKGGYFQNTTMKAFISFPVGKQFVVCPEIIFTNNFKQVFPGVTIRF